MNPRVNFAPRAWLLLACLTCLASCARGPEVAFFADDAYPERLSAWGLLSVGGERLELAADTHVYDLNTALFTDYALKLRTLYLPPGTAASYQDYEHFVFPTGSIIAKTFLYKTDAQGAVLLDADWDGNPANLDMRNARLLETRLLVKQAHGWDALPYIWQGDDAYLAITGELMTLPASGAADLNYLVPSRNQCASCHATDHTSGALKPIGIKARHLNRLDPVHGQNQLTAWQARDQLIGLPELQQVQANADFTDEREPLAHRARSYLDINCGHCHNAAGAADTSGLLLDYQPHADAALGVCKPPIAAGRGSGGHLYSIVPGDAAHSILTYRMNTSDPSTMMPELGRTLVHSEGHTLVSQWVDAMPGACL